LRGSKSIRGLVRVVNEVGDRLGHALMVAGK
jgi:hypothetical protein